MWHGSASLFTVVLRDTGDSKEERERKTLLMKTMKEHTKVVTLG